MVRFRSLSSKLIFMGIVMLIFLAIYIYSDLRFTQEMKGNATAINLAGRLRFLSFEISWNLQRIEKTDPETRKSLITYLIHETEMIDWIITDFKNGNRDLNIEPIIHYKGSIEPFNIMLEEWNDVLKPMILRFAELKGEGPEAMELFSKYNFSVYRYVYDRIDDFVKSLEDHTEGKIKEFDRFRIYVFGFFLIITVFIIFYANKSILKPVRILRDAIDKIEKGNFDTRVNVKTKDEIGVLGNAFNKMAQSLNTIFSENIRNLREIEDLSENLEQKVKERTEEIALANKEIREFDLKLRYLYEMSFASMPDTKEFASFILNHVSEMLDVDGAAVGNITDNEWIGFAVSDRKGLGIKEGMRLPLNEVYCDIVNKTKKPLIINDATKSDEFKDHPDLIKYGIVSYCGAPLFIDKDFFGVLCTFGKSPHFYSDHDVILQELLSKRLEFEFIKAKYENELLASMFEAQAANRAKSEFLANMSHELRTPLNSVMGFSQMMLEGMAGDMTDQQKDFMKNIYDGGKHLLSLIDDILDLSRIEAGKIELELTEFSIKDLIERSMTFFKEKGMKHNIKLTTEIEPDAGLIEADERRIKQVVLNLLSNAFKFTPDGGSVSVHARKIQDSRLKIQDHEEKEKNIESGILNLESQRDFIEITVTDTGIGISPEDQKRLFQPFQQLERVYSKRYPGAGLGLNLCKKFVELHGGRIWVESDLGKGSKFIFTIPIRQNT